MDALVSQRQVVHGGLRRLAMLEHGVQAAGTKVVADGGQALGALGVARPHVVPGTGRMGEKSGRHENETSQGR